MVDIRLLKKFFKKVLGFRKTKMMIKVKVVRKGPLQGDVVKAKILVKKESF